MLNLRYEGSCFFSKYLRITRCHVVKVLPNYNSGYQVTQSFFGKSILSRCISTVCLELDEMPAMRTINNNCFVPVLLLASNMSMIQTLNFEMLNQRKLQNIMTEEQHMKQRFVQLCICKNRAFNQKPQNIQIIFEPKSPEA